jgi:hypothetical protein
MRRMGRTRHRCARADCDWGQDLLLISETSLHPYFDFSPAYITNYKFLNKFFDIGAGVNFYHWFPIDDRLTTPGRTIQPPSNEPNQLGVQGGKQRYYRVVDTTGGRRDTMYYTSKGIKLMARLAIDPKPIFSSPIFGKNDLILYCEAAIIGLQNYKYFYDTLSQRIPIMVGFNVPTFKLLDVLSCEVEYYGCHYKNDARNLQAVYAVIPSGLQDTSFNVKGDDWKWSIYANKIIMEHFSVSLQFANDHMRLSNGFIPVMLEALTSNKDWYWMGKVSYSF